MPFQANRLKKISSPRLAELVATELSQLIAGQELKAGQQLPTEQQLATKFEVARSVVREALVRLNALGIVEVYQGKGAFVAELPVWLLLTRIQQLSKTTDEMLPHVWEMREVLETAIAEMAAERRNSEDLDELQAAVHAMEHAIEAGRLGMEEDAAFHRHLTRASHNPALEQVMAGMASLIEPARRHSLEQPGRPGTANEEHARLLAAVRKRDRHEAKAVMRAHMAYGRRLSATLHAG